MAVRNTLAVQLTSVIVLTFSLVLLGILYTVTKSSQKAALKSEQNLKLQVYFNEDLKSDSDFQWIEQIKALPEVFQISFLNQSEAQEDFKKIMAADFGSLTEEASLLSRLPASIAVQFQEGLTSETKRQTVSEIIKVAQQIPSYDGYTYQQEWAQWLSTLVEKSREGFLLIGGFVLLIFFLIISNVVRNQVLHKQEEIEIHSFLGATPWQIEKPFLAKAIMLGIISSVAASGFILGLIQVLKNQMKNFEDTLSSDILVSPNFFELFIMMMIVTAIAAWAARTCVRERVV